MGPQWGYVTAQLPNPLERSQKTDLLIRHCLKFHCREILYQLLIGEAIGKVKLFEQTEEERERIADLLRSLNKAIATAGELCSQYQLGDCA